MIFSPDDIQAAKEALKIRFNIFIAQHFSGSFFTTQEKQELENIGVDVSRVKIEDSFIYKMFVLGMLSGAISNETVNNSTMRDFNSFLKSDDGLKLTSYEKGLLVSLESQSFSDIRGIRDRIADKVTNEAERAQREVYEKVIRKEIKEGLSKKESLKVISNNISKNLQDFGRDFDRAVQYVSHQAFDEGRAAYFERYGGSDQRVFKDVYDGACKHCVRLYTTAGIGSKPIVFKLSTLRANGTNIGRKTEDWKPVVGSTHNFCRCTLSQVPDGYEWSEEKKKFVLSKEPRKVQRASKAKIVFAGKEYIV